MIKILSSSLFTSCLLFSATHTQANTDMTERLLGISQYMLDSFALKPLDHQHAFIQFGADMKGISFQEAEKIFLKEKTEIPSSTRDVMRENFLSEFTKKDYPLVEPAIDHYINIQSELIGSCKVSKNYTQPHAQTFLMPVTCNLPKVDWDKLESPTFKEKDSAAQNFVMVMNWMSKTLEDAPRQTLKTHILIENQEGLLVANPDDPLYFPDTVTRKLTGDLSDEDSTESSED